MHLRPYAARLSRAYATDTRHFTRPLIGAHGAPPDHPPVVVRPRARSPTSPCRRPRRMSAREDVGASQGRAAASRRTQPERRGESLPVSRGSLRSLQFYPQRLWAGFEGTGWDGQPARASLNVTFDQARSYGSAHVRTRRSTIRARSERRILLIREPLRRTRRERQRSSIRTGAEEGLGLRAWWWRRGWVSGEPSHVKPIHAC